MAQVGVDHEDALSVLLGKNEAECERERRFAFASHGAHQSDTAHAVRAVHGAQARRERSELLRPWLVFAKKLREAVVEVRRQHLAFNEPKRRDRRYRRDGARSFDGSGLFSGALPAVFFERF